MWDPSKAWLVTAVWNRRARQPQNPGTICSLNEWRLNTEMTLLSLEILGTSLTGILIWAPMVSHGRKQKRSYRTPEAGIIILKAVMKAVNVVLSFTVFEKYCSSVL